MPKKQLLLTPINQMNAAPPLLGTNPTHGFVQEIGDANKKTNSKNMKNNITMKTHQEEIL